MNNDNNRGTHNKTKTTKTKTTTSLMNCTELIFFYSTCKKNMLPSSPKLVFSPLPLFVWKTRQSNRKAFLTTRSAMSYR